VPLAGEGAKMVIYHVWLTWTSIDPPRRQRGRDVHGLKSLQEILCNRGGLVTAHV